MRHILIAGHSRISEGIASAVELIIGEKIKYFNAYLPGEPFFVGKIMEEIKKYSCDDEVIIVTDMLGGSVNNEMQNFLNYDNVHLICGMNLALIIGLVMADENENISTVIEECIEEAKSGISYCNLWKHKEAQDLDEF